VPKTAQSHSHITFEVRFGAFRQSCLLLEEGGCSALAVETNTSLQHNKKFPDGAYICRERNLILSKITSLSSLIIFLPNSTQNSNLRFRLVSKMASLIVLAVIFAVAQTSEHARSKSEKKNQLSLSARDNKSSYDLGRIQNNMDANM
jgi:hypothetical protein